MYCTLKGNKSPIVRYNRIIPGICCSCAVVAVVANIADVSVITIITVVSVVTANLCRYDCSKHLRDLYGLYPDRLLK